MAIRHKKSPRSPSDSWADPHAGGVDWHENHVIDGPVDFKGHAILNCPSVGGGPHSHAISDTTGLQTALDGKSGTSHNHDASYATTGHTHSSGGITGLQTALDGKAATSHTHSAGGISGLGNSATRNVGTGSGDVSAGNHTHAGGGADVKSGTVNLTAGGTANVTFTTPFSGVPVVQITAQFANTDTSCTYSARNVTVNGFTAGGAGNPAGVVGWIATNAGNG